MSKNKGFIMSTYVYIILTFFLLMLSTILLVMNNTKLLSNKLKDQIIDSYTLNGNDKVTAEDLSYENVNSGVNCNDSQCMIDYIAGMLS